MISAIKNKDEKSLESDREDCIYISGQESSDH